MPIYKKVNKDFFKKWSPQMAYVLGFFAADGYMTENKRGGCFWNIQITDKNLLQNIKKVIKSEHKISVRKGKGKESDLYRIQIGSKEMYHDLYNLGMRQNKNKSITIPCVPDMYFKDFVRGYFDGDGNVWVGRMHKKRKVSTLVISSHFTSCSIKFLKKLQTKLESFGIRGGCIYRPEKNYSRLQYSIKNSLKLYNFMYNKLDKSNLFLKRKKVRFEEYMKTIDNAVVV